MQRAGKDMRRQEKAEWTKGTRNVLAIMIVLGFGIIVYVSHLFSEALSGRSSKDWRAKPMKLYDRAVVVVAYATIWIAIVWGSWRLP